MARFDEQLLLRLSPPGIKVELLHYGGSLPGQRVHLRLRILGLIRQEWESEITEAGEHEGEIYFTDEGRRLPFGLTSWRHRHIVRQAGPGHSIIIDDIHYSSRNALLDLLLWPLFYVQFAYRKPVYRAFFRRMARQQRTG